MKHTILILLLGTWFGSISEINEVQYTINIQGTNVYSKPTLESEIIERFKIGSEILVIETIESSEKLKISEYLFLEGDFIKIKADGLIGFIFSSDLSKHQPAVITYYEDIQTANLLGPMIDQRTEERKVKYGEREFTVKDRIYEYEFATRTETSFDGCFDHTYDLKNLSFNEVYHQLINSNIVVATTSGGNFIEVPKFKGKEENVYHFYSDGATEDLRIIDNKDGTYRIYSYDCT